MTPPAGELLVLLLLLVALTAWTILAGADATLALARDLARTRDGPRQLGGLFFELHRHPRRLLISLALGRELALVAAAALGAQLGYGRGGMRGGIVGIALVALVLLVLRGGAGGRAVRRLAARRRVGPALGWLLAPLRAVAGIMRGVGRRLTHVLLGEAPSGDNVFAREEFAALGPEADEELAAGERALVAKAISFGERTVRHVLTPRRDIVTVPIDVPPDDLLAVIRRSGCSRIPVYREQKDDVVGILYVKDVIGRPLALGGIEALLRQPYVVPVDKPIAELFHEFRTRKVHFALVLDEYGSLVGLVTMEDLLEELFGEIRDEFDDDEAPLIRRRGPDTFEVSGRASVDAVNARLRIAIPPSDDEATIAGVVIDRLGRVPEVGETLHMDGVTFTVEKLDGRAIELLRLDLWPSSSSS